MPNSHTEVQPQFDPNEWHTIEGAAELLKVSPRRMRRWMYRGQVGSKVLPGGRGRRISGAHLNEAMAATPDAKPSPLPPSHAARAEAAKARANAKSKPSAA